MSQKGLKQEIESVCAAAHARAREARMPVLANVALDIGTPDLPALTKAMTRAKEFLFSWEPPAARTALTGGGSAVRIRSSGNGRFTETAEKIEAPHGVDPAWGLEPVSGLFLSSTIRASTAPSVTATLCDWLRIGCAGMPRFATFCKVEDRKRSEH